MRRATLQSVAWGAGGALALTALVYWLSERASSGLASEGSRAQRSAEAAPQQTDARATVGPAPAAPTPAAPSEVSVGGLPASAPAENPSDEAALMAELRRVKDSDPARAIELCRAGQQRYPDSADAPERASILIHALAGQGQTSEARGEAEDMVNRYPDSQWVREIEQFTGAHRHRNVRLDAQGRLEYY